MMKLKRGTFQLFADFLLKLFFSFLFVKCEIKLSQLINFFSFIASNPFLIARIAKLKARRNCHLNKIISILKELNLYRKSYIKLTFCDHEIGIRNKNRYGDDKK